jgi:hypothetical protein
MVHFPRIKEGTEAAKGHPQNFSQSRRVWGGIAAAVSTAVCVASMMVLAHNPSSVPRRQGAIPDQRTTQLMEGLGGGGGVDPASLAEFTRYLEGGVKRKSRRDRTVTCDGGSSVACVASGAMEGIESDLQRSPDTPGKEAVEVASRGRGFQAWPSRWATAIRSCVEMNALSDCWFICTHVFISARHKEKTRFFSREKIGTHPISRSCNITRASLAGFWVANGRRRVGKKLLLRRAQGGTMALNGYSIRYGRATSSSTARLTMASEAILLADRQNQQQDPREPHHTAVGGGPSGILRHQ